MCLRSVLIQFGRMTNLIEALGPLRMVTTLLNPLTISTFNLVRGPLVVKLRLNRWLARSILRSFLKRLWTGSLHRTVNDRTIPPSGLNTRIRRRELKRAGPTFVP